MHEIHHQDLRRVFPLLDQLQTGFVVVSPELKFTYSNPQARQFLGRRALHGTADQLFGPSLFADLLEPLLGGRQMSGAQWCEIKLKTAEDVLDAAVRCVQVSFPKGRYGVVIAFHDISVEVALHGKYRTLLERQKGINRKLRQQIAETLREHEDDISQFSEILQIAPTIFGSFVSEANAALDLVRDLAHESQADDGLTSAKRAMHTLKGNARSLGLNFIGGRAHAVEDLLARATDDQPLPEEHREALGEQLDDLRRAVERAGAIRQRLGETTAKAATGMELEQYETLTHIHGLVSEARHLAEEDEPVRRLLQKAGELLDRCARIPLDPLVEYLRTTVANTANAMSLTCPDLDASVGGVSVIPSVYQAMSVALPHLVRNAVTHGIECEQERLLAEKKPTGTIGISARNDRNWVVITVRDDGRGLNFDRLRKKAGEHGLDPNVSKADLAQLIFLPGVSTADAVTMDSGRGMGTHAAEEAVLAVGGTICAACPPAGGTLFTVRVPANPTGPRGDTRVDYPAFMPSGISSEVDIGG